MLEVKDLSVIFTKKILDQVSFTVEEGDWLMIIGPNGAGKTTITNAIAQSLSYSGQIYFKGSDLKDLPAKTRAKNLGVLMQNHYISYAFAVKDVVSLGSYSRDRGFFSKKTDDEDDKIEKALDLTGISSLKDRSVLSLSGGELQRVFLAQLLVQDPRLMILDEPTNHLDLSYQEAIFSLVDKWRQESGRAVISVVHDLRLARMFGTKALLLKEGKVFSYGDIEDVMTRENLRDVYGIDVYQWMNRLNEGWDL